MRFGNGTGSFYQAKLCYNLQHMGGICNEAIPIFYNKHNKQPYQVYGIIDHISRIYCLCKSQMINSYHKKKHRTPEQIPEPGPQMRKKNMSDNKIAIIAKNGAGIAEKRTGQSRPF